MYVGDDEQADYSIPEIQRLSLDSVVLKLANINIDARNIEFVHQPSFINIENSMDTLYMLGLLDMGRKITELGKKVNKLPISPRYGRMLIEAVRYGVADVVSAVVAIMEIGQLSIKDFVYNKTVKSDLELNIDLFIQGCGLRTQGARHYEYKEEGISWRTFDRVYELFMKINRIANRIEDEEYYNSEMDEMERVKASILSGSKDRIYRYRRTVFIGDDMEKRLLPRDSKTKYEVAVCGVPFDIELVNNRGPYVLKLITLSFGM
jgi:HrpA-like RNA helicase